MLPFVTIIIPTLNEEASIVDCIKSLLTDTYPRDRLEIVVVDGGSTDRTVAVVQETFPLAPTSTHQSTIRVIYNPARFQSSAFNEVMRQANHSDYIFRCDAHALYPPGFISAGVAVLDSHPEVGVAVSNAHTRVSAKLCGWQQWFQTATAFAQMSPLGVGRSTYRRGVNWSGYVDHGWHGLFRRRAVLELGGYDVAFRVNEDAELSHRLQQRGWKIWLDARLTATYYPRSTLGGLALQYWAYGGGRAKNVLKNKTPIKLRQLAPVALAAGTPPLLILSLLSPGFLLPLLAYVALVAVVAVRAAISQRDPRLLLTALVFPVMHFAWGTGFLAHAIQGFSSSACRK